MFNLSRGKLGNPFFNFDFKRKSNRYWNRKFYFFYIRVFLVLILGEAPHPNTKYPLILKTPPGVHYLGMDRLVTGGRDKSVMSTYNYTDTWTHIAFGPFCHKYYKFPFKAPNLTLFFGGNVWSKTTPKLCSPSDKSNKKTCFREAGFLIPCLIKHCLLAIKSSICIGSNLPSFKLT